jgi:hypothetical protein
VPDARVEDVVEQPGPPQRWDTEGYELELDEQFGGRDLDARRWLPVHLPQWSSRAQSAARYRVADGRLVLRVDADQEPWCPALDGRTRVSNLQTGVFSGPVGSTVGQHRFSPDVVVREVQPEQRLYTPRFGLVEVTAAACPDPDAMVALWMIGFEDVPERSAEICVCEVFGREMRSDSAAVGMGLHPFGDPTITDAFTAERYPIDARLPHTYGVRWEPDRVGFYLDGSLVTVVPQAPQYPMQLMLGIYDFADRSTVAAPGAHDAGAVADAYPKEFVVHRVRGYRPR